MFRVQFTEQSELRTTDYVLRTFILVHIPTDEDSVAPSLTIYHLTSHCYLYLQLFGAFRLAYDDLRCGAVTMLYRR